MKNLSTHNIIFCAFLLLLIMHSNPTISEEVEYEKEFNYVKGSGIGPESWGDLHQEWASCKKGDMQSPIDLLHERVQVIPNLHRLKRNYKSSNATLKNRGHYIMLEWVNGAGSIYVNGTEYMLKQCHWHSPSEHTIDGKRYDLELHIVHQTMDNRTAVVGIVYEIGRPDTFLLELMEHIRSIANSHGMQAAVGEVHPRDIKMGSRKYYRYMGSLTTPPCNEGVVWTIVKKGQQEQIPETDMVRTVSKEQVKLLRMAVDEDAESNARPTQPLNERDIYLYSPQQRHNEQHP